MVPFKLKELAKFGLCLNCSRKLDKCSLDRARKKFFQLLTCSDSRKNVLNYRMAGKHASAMEGNECLRFAGVLLKLTRERILRERYPQR